MKICPTCLEQFASDDRFCPRDGSILQPMALAGNMVGKLIGETYRVLRLLGEGGTSQVYLAEHLRMGRRCAIKVLRRTHWNDSDAVNRFIREAANASRINHPNVASIFDFGETSDKLLYLAQEYVEGDSLSQILKRDGELPFSRAVEIARQIADAVGSAHELSIVHRDLKPDNVLIGRWRDGTDQVKVVDFGISKSMHDDEHGLTQAGFAVGTPSYMSPEQIVGDRVDPRTDIYSLGCILFEMLTGTKAFDGKPEAIVARLTEDPPSPRAINPKISAELDAVVAKALARSPTNRYRSMDEVCTALTTAVPLGAGTLHLKSWTQQAPDPSEAQGRNPGGSPERLSGSIPPPMADDDSPSSMAGVDDTVVLAVSGPEIESTAGGRGASPPIVGSAGDDDFSRVDRPAPVGKDRNPGGSRRWQAAGAVLLLVVGAGGLWQALSTRGADDLDVVATAFEGTHDVDSTPAGDAPGGPAAEPQAEPADIAAAPVAPPPAATEAPGPGRADVQAVRERIAAGRRIVETTSPPNYEAALQEFRAAVRQSAALQAAYPGSAEARQLAIDARNGLGSTETSCTTLRQVLVARGDAGPSVPNCD